MAVVVVLFHSLFQPGFELYAFFPSVLGFFSLSLSTFCTNLHSIGIRFITEKRNRRNKTKNQRRRRNAFFFSSYEPTDWMEKHMNHLSIARCYWQTGSVFISLHDYCIQWICWWFSFVDAVVFIRLRVEVCLCASDR